MMYRQQIQEKYARLVVQVGANLQPGQVAVISAPAERADFTALVAEECWKAGAEDVLVLFRDDVLRRLRYQYGALETLKQVPSWELEQRIGYPKGKACYITIEGDDPDALKGLDSTKVGAAVNARSHKMQPFYDMLDRGENQWTIAAVATTAWAAKVFPQLPPEEGMARLWDGIFQAMRLNAPDPVEAWREHDQALRRYCRLLNESGVTQLHFHSGLGTDLTVPLAQGAVWCGGSDDTVEGVSFQANMPTEEVFTMPHRNKVSGRVVSSMPLSYQGSLIKNFSFTFRQGQVVEYTAEEGLETLKMLLEADEGSRYLGEVALVPYTSPIRQSGLLFYSTLFDENASCHLALGSAYPSNMKDCLEMDRQQRAERGFNDSVSHVDFMFGTEDLLVVGQRDDGSRMTLFEKGVWVI